MTRARKQIYISVATILIATILLVTLCCGSSAVAYAATTISYSDVLDDLKKDSTFDMSYYPDVADDYKLDVITLAEGTNNELFVYVYQPSAKTTPLIASSINLSTHKATIDIVEVLPYNLSLVSANGVFQKYVVQNFTVRADLDTRYYSITTIYRPFDETLGDQQANGGNTVTYVEMNISRQYTFGKINGKEYIKVEPFETIKVRSKFVGFCRYKDGFHLLKNVSCDAHFVAFSVDRPIDKLIEADVTYSTQKYSWSAVYGFGSSENETFGEKQENLVAYLTDEDQMEYNGDGLWASSYVRDRIQSVDDFIADENFENVYQAGIFEIADKYELNETAMNELKNKQWVLRFTETTYTFNAYQNVSTRFSTIVGDVSILRLMFMYDGETYNLGVIDNKQSGSRDPVNDSHYEVRLSGDFLNFLDKVKFVFQLILGVVILVAAIWLVSIVVRAVKRIRKN